MPTTSALAPAITGCSGRSGAGEDGFDMAGDHQLLVGRHDPRGDLRGVGRDAGGPPRVGGLVERDAEPGRVAADARAQLGVVLADAGGDDDRVEAAERRGERAELAPDAMDEELDR